MGRECWRAVFPALAVCVCVLAHGAGRLERKPLDELLTLHKDRDARVDHAKLEGVLRERLSKEGTMSLLKIREESAEDFMCVDYFHPTILWLMRKKFSSQEADTKDFVLVQAVVRRVVHDREVLVGDILRRELSPLPTVVALKVVRSDPAGLPSEMKVMADLEWEYVSTLEEGKEYFLALCRNGNRHTFHHTQVYSVQDGRVSRALGRAAASVEEVWQAVDMMHKADRGEPFEIPQEWNAALREGSLEQVMGALEAAHGVGVPGRLDAPLLVAALERHYAPLRQKLDQCSMECVKKEELDRFIRTARLIYLALAETRDIESMAAAVVLYTRDRKHSDWVFRDCEEDVVRVIMVLPEEMRKEKLITLLGPSTDGAEGHR